MPELCAGLGVYEFRKMTLLGFSPTEAEVKRLLDLGYKVAVSYPGKGECADPVNEDAILEKEGAGKTPSRDKERQLASDTGGGKT